MKGALVILVSLFALNAHARIYFEPMVGYEGMGSTQIDYTDAGKTQKGVGSESGKNTPGVSYGGRLGWLSQGGIWIAGEYTGMTQGTIKYDTREDKYERSAIGADLGVWKGRWNFWVGYNFTDKMDILQANKTEKEHLTGTALRAGLGFMIDRYLVLNLEAASRTYTDSKSDTNDTLYSDFTKYYKGYSQFTYTAGLSFPF